MFRGGSIVSLWITVVWGQTSNSARITAKSTTLRGKIGRAPLKLCRWNISPGNVPWSSCPLLFHELCNFFFFLPGRLQITGQGGTDRAGKNSWDAEKCISFKGKDSLVLPTYFPSTGNVMGLKKNKFRKEAPHLKLSQNNTVKDDKSPCYLTDSPAGIQHCQFVLPLVSVSLSPFNFCNTVFSL